MFDEINIRRIKGPATIRVENKFELRYHEILFLVEGSVSPAVAGKEGHKRGIVSGGRLSAGSARLGSTKKVECLIIDLGTSRFESKSAPA